MRLHVEQGGSGGRTCLLLHGLGANAEVWRPLISVIESDGGWRWIALDLRGHGRSPWSPDYAPASLAADVAETVGDKIEGAVVLGHSMGGVVAIGLAADPAPLPAVAFGLGIKVIWSAAERERLAELAARPAKVLADRDAAIDRHLKVCGLTGLAAPDDAVATAGVAAVDGGWRLAMDPAANGVGAPDMDALMAAVRRPVRLARGADDHLVDLAALRAFDPEACDLAGAGHNAMVEAPLLVWRWVRSWTS